MLNYGGSPVGICLKIMEFGLGTIWGPGGGKYQPQKIKQTNIYELPVPTHLGGSQLYFFANIPHWQFWLQYKKKQQLTMAGHHPSKPKRVKQGNRCNRKTWWVTTQQYPFCSHPNKDQNIQAVGIFMRLSFVILYPGPKQPHIVMSHVDTISISPGLSTTETISNVATWIYLGLVQWEKHGRNIQKQSCFSCFFSQCFSHVCVIN